MKSQNQDLKEKIKEIIKHDPFLKSRIPHTWEQIWEEQTDQILALLEAEKQKWAENLRKGKICHNCGAKKDQNLSDWCGKCLEEN